MDCVVPGGVARDLDAAACARDRATQCDALAARGRACCATSTTSTPACRTASSACGIVTPELAAQLGLTGLAGRASGQALRSARAISRRRPTTRSTCAMATHRDGDVAARVAVRFDELVESLRLIARSCSTRCRTASIAATLPTRRAYALGAGLGRRLARRRCSSRSRRGAGRRDPPLPSARSVVAELAGARARGDRQHRSRLPADQQVVQPVATAGTISERAPSRCCHILSQIARTGIKTEPRAGARRSAARRAPRVSSATILAHRSAARSRSATSTPARATAASSRSTRSTTRTTTSKASASASSRARAMPTCCS